MTPIMGFAASARLGAAGFARAVGRRSFEMLPLDVTSDQSVEAVVTEVIRLDGRIDLLASASQFSREYARVFGQPPRRDAKRVRDAVAGGTPIT